jgi:diaminohydroxyphosphoribosylaminopyrimidine deaminase/5-amino-6-(5-phosphoribosylamino)uracil reductase
MVGAILVRGGRELGRGWHRRAGEPHAEIEALLNARQRGHGSNGATLYVTLEPCSTRGRTPPCTEALIAAGVRRVVVGAIDPNPRHRGRGLSRLRESGLEVARGVLESECGALNESFNHWIVHRTPWVVVKAAMTLDGKIADAQGRSRWITGPAARRHSHKLRQGADAILVGIRTILADDPRLTARGGPSGKALRRIVLDPAGRTPVSARVIRDRFRHLTTIVVTGSAPPRRVEALRARVAVWVAPGRTRRINLRWLLRRLGREQVTSLLVEGGGETIAGFLSQRLAHRVVFFYAPKILTGRDSYPAVGGEGAVGWEDVLRLEKVEWRQIGPDILLTARIGSSGAGA